MKISDFRAYFRPFYDKDLRNYKLHIYYLANTKRALQALYDHKRRTFSVGSGAQALSLSSPKKVALKSRQLADELTSLPIQSH